MKKFIKLFAIILIGLLLFMVVSFLYATAGVDELDDEIRTSLNKDFVGLKQGSICYAWSGPLEGEIIVMVHGFSTPRIVFMQNVTELAEAGFRVLTFDHFGRGYSDRPKVKYDKQFYDDELLELLEVLGIETPVNLIGYSMGGGIVTVFGATHPERVKRLVIMAPIGFIPKPQGVMKYLLIPGLGEWLMNLQGRQTLIENFYAEVERGVAPKSMADSFKEQFEYEGVEQALVSTLRNYPMDDMTIDFQQLGKTSYPKLLIWGTEDSVCPISGSEKIFSMVPGIEFLKIEGGEHTIPYSHSKIVNSGIIKFLRS